jgi:excisionase family DNA binding protein
MPLLKGIARLYQYTPGLNLPTQVAADPELFTNSGSRFGEYQGIRKPMKRLTETDPPIAYTISEAANTLSISRGSMYKLIGKGAISVIRPLPDAPRILKTELDRFVSELSQV